MNFTRLKLRMKVFVLSLVPTVMQLASAMLLMVLLLLPITALAQVIVTSATQPQDLLPLILNAAQKGQWGIVVSAALVLLVFVLRLAATKLPEAGIFAKVKAALTAPLAGWLLTFGFSLGGGLLAAYTSAQPVNALLIVTCLTNAVTGAGVWELMKDLGIAKSVSSSNGIAPPANPPPVIVLPK